MPRTMSTPMTAAVTANEIFPALFVMCTFLTGPVYLWTGYGPITWNGQTWLGVGTLGSIGAIEEGSTVEAKGITLTLTGIPTVVDGSRTLLGDILGEFQLGLPVIVYLAAFASTTAISPIADPLVAWSGRMDQPEIDVDGTTATITISCENRLLDLNTPVPLRYTNEDQQLAFPGDRAMEFVNGLQEVTIYWGVVPNSNNNR